MEENFLLAKQTVLKKYSENHPYYPFFVCALYGLLQKYKNKKVIVRAFLEATIYIENDTVKNICRKHNLNVHDELNCLGVCLRGDEPSFDEEGNVQIKSDKKFIICREINNPSILLNIFCHEFGHLIKAYNRFYTVRKHNNITTIKARTGLMHVTFSFDNKTKKESDTEYKYMLLDEAINCIQTTEVLEEILLLKELIKDPKIKEYLDSLDDYSLINDKGYKEATSTLRKLWKVDSFKRLIEDHIVNGDIENLFRIIEDYMGYGFLDLLNKVLENEYSNDKDSHEINEDEDIDRLIKLWRERFKEYVYTYNNTHKD